MTSEDYAAQITPNPATGFASMPEIMALQSQQAQERDALTAQQRVADAIMKASQPTPYQWQQRKGRRFATPSGGGLDQVGSMLQGLAAKYAQGQAQNDLREQQRKAMMGMFTVPPSAAIATSDPSRYGITGD